MRAGHLPLVGSELDLNRGSIDPMPHPDGQPWVKCCKGVMDNDQHCQCFMKKPTNNISRCEEFAGHADVAESMTNGQDRFFCVHRKTDDGYHRICAGWAAKFGNKKR